MYYIYIKRITDFSLSLICIIVFAFPILFIAVIIKIDSPGPVLFKQIRVGIHKSHFMIYKFRRMRIDAPNDTPTHKLYNANSYITRCGAFLRKTSLDEIPQIFNILKGDMSIIEERGIIETTKKNADFSRVVTVNSISL